MVYFFIGKVIKTDAIEGFCDQGYDTAGFCTIVWNEKDIQQNIQHHERYGDADKKPDKTRGCKNSAIYLY